VTDNHDNHDFFQKNVDYYSCDYKSFTLRPWENQIRELCRGNVLDVACGGGRMTIPLLHDGHNVTGTDFVTGFELKIRQRTSEFRGEFRFVTASMDSLPLPNESFDTVTCINSIVYMPDRSRLQCAISEMARVLKPAGRLYITTWNILNPLWGTSLVLNCALNGGKRFGETSPFFKTLWGTTRGKTEMYVPPVSVLREMLMAVGITGDVYHCDRFARQDSSWSRFLPILVIAGVKR